MGVENLSSIKILFVVLANLAHSVLAQGTTEKPRIDYQEQIFILAGVFGGACVVLLLAVIALAICVVKLKSGVRKAELRGDSRQAAPPAGHGQVSHLPTPSIPDMTAKVNQGYLPDLAHQEQGDHQGHHGHQGHSQGAAFDEQDMEPVRPSRPRYGEEVPFGRGGPASQSYAPSSQGGQQAPQFGSQFSWEPLPRVGGRGQQGRY